MHPITVRSAPTPRRSRFTRLPLVATALAVAASAGMAVPASAAPAQAAAAATDYTSFVNPFMSTEGDDGQNLPGAQVPHGLAKPNPMTFPGRSHTGYDYSQSQIKGFTMSNLDGVGGSGAGGDLLVVPTYQTYTARPDTNTYALPFSHDDETAAPGYYQVGLRAGQGTIDAELTATVRSGLAKFEFPAAGQASLVLDLANNFTGRLSSALDVRTLEDGRAELSGTVVGTFNGNNYRLFFDSVTNVPVSGVKTWGDGSGLSTAKHRSGTDTGAIISFDVAAGDDVQLTTTLSPISVAQARTDRVAELGTSSFDDVRAAAHQDWQDTLARVAVGSDATADPDGSLEGIFYTSLYRVLATPVNATSTDGTYQGIDGKVHHADGYTHYDGWGTWDDFRKYSVLAYLYPDQYADVVQSLVDLYADDASIGSPSLNSGMHAVPTVRFERAAIVIADAVSKGVHLDRLPQAYPAIVANANTYNAANQALGYLAGDPGTTVATSYDDYALSVIATELGKTADATADLARSNNYRNVIKPGAWTTGDGTPVGVLSWRDAAGNFGSDDLAQFQAAGLYQGTLWQFNWYAAHDMAGLIQKMGGTTAVRAALSNYFGEQAPDDGTKMLKSNANEVDLQTPYLFNYLGQPAKTQKWVRDLYTKETWQNYIATGQTNGNTPPSSNGQLTPPIKQKVFKLSPDGFLPTMDDDTGAMSATFVAAAVGLYPVTAGSSQYQVGSPFFPSVDISHADGTSFSVTADGVSADSYYVQSATLDGKAYGNTWVDYADLVGDGSFDTVMGTTPSSWGTTSEPAFSTSTATAATPATGTVTSNTTTTQADAEGVVGGHLVLTLAGGTFAGTNGDDLAALGLVSTAGLPDGVHATVTRTSPTTLDVHVTGTLTVVARTRFAVRLHDGALAGGLLADDVTGTGLSLLDPFAIVVAARWRAELRADFAEARLVIQANYTGPTYDALVTARDAARTVLADADATDVELADAASAVTSAMDAMTLSQGGYRRLEGEQSDSWSGGTELHNETGNLGGVRPGSWIAFDGVSFAADDLPDQVSVRYSGASNDGYLNAAVEVHVGAVDGPLVATVATPPTEANFGTYATVTADLTDVAPLTGDGPKTIYFVFTGSDATTVRHWVGNYDWMQFASSTAPVAADVALTADNRADWRTDTSAGGGVLKTEAATWNDGPHTVIANTHDADWVHWAAVDLGHPTQFSVHYVNNSSRVGTNTSVDVYLDSMTGSPVVNVPLPVTGADWNTSGTATVNVPGAVTGTHDVYVVLHTTPDAGHPYVGNFASFTFSTPVNTADGVALPAAERDAWSGGDLKTETSSWDDGTTVTNVGGTSDGAWLQYDDVAFADTATSLSVHYVNNSSRCGANSRVDVFLDSMTGTPVASQPLPVTGTGWSNAGTTTMTLPTAITGTHTVYFVLHTTPDANHPFVANLDSFTFNYGVDKTALQQLRDTYQPLLADSARYVGVDVRTLTEALATADDVLADDTALAADVKDAAKTLQLAGGQLDPRAEREVLAALRDADAVQPLAYTDASVAALDAEVAKAKALLATGTASDADLSAEAAAVMTAIAALVPRTTSAPLPPTAVSATASGRSLTVTWAAPEYDGGSAVTGYVVELAGPDAGSSTSKSLDAATTSYTFTGLVRGYDYRARVVAVNALGSSEASSYTAYVPIAQTAPTAPARPAVTVSRGDVTVTWTVPDDGGSALTGYLVKLGSGPAVTVPATATSHTFTDVAPGTYTATVAAVNAIGASASSLASPAVTVVVSPRVSEVTAAATSSSRVVVGWTVTGTTEPVVLTVALTYRGAVVTSKQVRSDVASTTFADLVAATTYGVSVGVLDGADAPTTATVRTLAAPKVTSHAVQITGKPKLNGRLAVALHKAAWSAGTRFTYVWLVGGKKVGQAATLKVTRAMLGKRVTVRVTGSHAGWTSATVTSKAVKVKR